MNIHAYKYQGAGNDFVIVDNRSGRLHLTTKQIKLLCDRRFGIGADGFMMLGKSKKYNFSMRYFNADGREGTMCGNGGRCIVAFAARMGIKEFEFEAIDGYHNAKVLSQSGNTSSVKLKMADVEACHAYGKNSYFLNTGSPHYVEFVKNLKDYPVEEKGKYWRYKIEGGTNVNFVEPNGKTLTIRTYERGVEAETFACGTGATASAIAAYTAGIAPASSKSTKDNSGVLIKYNLKALGGKLSVEALVCTADAGKSKRFTQIYLTGPASYSFECDFEL